VVVFFVNLGRVLDLSNTKLATRIVVSLTQVENMAGVYGNVGQFEQEVETTYNRAFLTPLFALIKTLRAI